MTKISNLEGLKYNRLTVVSRASNNPKGRTQWNCLCDCGASVVVTALNLKSHNTRSCGCYKLEKLTVQKGLSRTPEYKTWHAMVQRGSTKSSAGYAKYGALGIDVCEEWILSFESFILHVGPRPDKRMTLDRIDNLQGYKPGNVRWATRLQQQANRKNTYLVTYQGVEQPLSLLARAHGVCPKKAYYNIKYKKWTVTKALNTFDNVREGES